MAYVYNNSEYVSKVNDFGDDYHKPESEYDSYDKEVIRKLRSMKRTYRDVNEFCEAKSLYIRYTKDLIKKYGGKRRFKQLYHFGFVKDYVPFCPTLRKIKKNRYFYKNGENADDKLRMDYKLPPIEEVEVKAKNINWKFKSKGLLVKGNITRDVSKVESVNNDLDIITQFYQRRERRRTSPTNLSKKEYKKQLLKEKYLVDPEENMSLTKRYERYLEKKASYTYDDEETDTTYIYYKDSMLSKDEIDAIELYDTLKTIGFGDNANLLTKKSRKVVKNKRRVKFSKKGKKKKKGNKYLNQYTGGNYSTYEEFENAMISMVEGNDDL